jgi:hypothetical protein
MERTVPVESTPRMTGNQAKGCHLSGHSLWLSDGSAGTSKARSMKRMLILISIVFAVGCSSSNTNNTGSAPVTSMAGAWTVTGNLGSQGGSGTYQVSLVSSPCSVETAVGTFSVQGPVCFIANNNSGQGSISGSGLPGTSKNTGQGVLIGVASNPVPANGTFNLLFVVGYANGDFVEFTGSGTIGNGTMTGTGSCSPNTPLCQGMSGTFSGNQ